jgi:Pyruvate/2-oxoacid:ferredoxin oxidoreductase delta subunit
MEVRDASKIDKRDRGLLRVDQNECKGCGLCVEACPPKAIRMGEQLNRYGYRTASYAGAGCTGCGICFMVCPEPGAITVMRLLKAGMGQAGTERTGPAQAGEVRTGTVARAS